MEGRSAAERRSWQSCSLHWHAGLFRTDCEGGGLQSAVQGAPPSLVGAVFERENRIL